MVPDWAPNIHPMIVHFPIALLIVAVLSDLVALLWPRVSWPGALACGLLVLGALSAWAAFLSGRQAADGILLPEAAEEVLGEHADWALWTALFYTLLAALRLAALWRYRLLRPALHRLFFLAAAGGLVLVFETGEHGAQLVYQYGVGVGAVDKSAMAPHDHSAHGRGEASGGEEGHGHGEEGHGHGEEGHGHGEEGHGH